MFSRIAIEIEDLIGFLEPNTLQKDIILANMLE